jgi:hypothetical protein
MFLTIVAWIFFSLTSFFIFFAVLDTFFQFSRDPLHKALGLRSHYMTDRMLIIVIVWAATGWFIFG